MKETPAWIKRLVARSACEEGIEWAKDFPTAKAAWEACHSPDWMVWALTELGKEDPIKLRLFTCWCVRHTPLADGRKVWDLLTDERSKNAVEVAEQFANGTASKAQLDAARAAARAAAWAAAVDAAWVAARAAARAARYAAWEAAGDAMYAARAAARAAAWAAAVYAAWVAARAARYAAWEAAGDAMYAARAAAEYAQANALRTIHPLTFTTTGNLP